MVDTNPYEATVASMPPTTANPYEPVVADLSATGPAKASLTAAQGANPDTTARALAVAGRLNVPVDVAERNLSDFEAIDQVNGYDQLLRDTPSMTKRWLAEPVNARVVGDDLPAVVGQAGLWRGLADAGRSALSGAVGFVGSSLYGVGEAYDVAARTVGRLAGAAGVPSTGVALPWYLDPAQILMRPGALIKDLGDQLAVPVARKNLADQVLEGVGQIGGQVASIAATGGVGGLAMLFGQGVDQMTDDVQKSGKAGTIEGDATLIGGGMVTAISEKLGLDLLVHRLPPAIKNKLARAVVDIAAAGGIEAAEEAIEQVGQNALSNYYLGAHKSLMDGTLAAAIPAGGSAAIVRAALLSGGRLRRRQVPNVAQPEQDAAALDQVTSAVRSTGLASRSPEKLAELLSTMGDSGNVYVPAAAVRTYLQSLEPEEAQKQVQALGIGDQLEQAMASGGDVVIPLHQYVAHAPEAMATAWHDDLRLRSAGMSINEAKAFKDGAGDLSDLVDDHLQQQSADNDAREQVASIVEKQLQNAGESPEAARQIAQLYAERYVTRAARLGQGDAASQYQRSGVEFRSDLPEAVRHAPADDFELLIRALKGKRDRSEIDRKGPTILQYISRNGGFVDADGEMVARDVGKWHLGKPFQRKVLRDVPANGEPIPGMVQGTGDNTVYGPDAWTRRLWEEGYFPEHQERPSTNDLYAAIDDELRGKPRYIEQQGKDWQSDFQSTLMDLDELLNRAGIDVRKASPEEIRKALQDPEGKVFEQAFRPKVFVEFGRKVADALAGRLRENIRLVLGRTSHALQLAGAPDLPMVTAVRVMTKAAGITKATDRTFHAVPPEILQRLPDLLERPVAVFESDTVEGAFVAVIDAKDANGDPVVVAIQPGNNVLRVNQVTSAYGKERAGDWVDRQVQAGHLRYLDTEKSRGLSATSDLGTALPAGLREAAPGLYLPGGDSLRGTASPGSGRKVATQADLVKKLNQPADDAARARGNIVFTTADGDRLKAIITLFKDRNLSTVLHETGHLWLEELQADAGTDYAPQQLKDDLDAVRRYLGAEGDAPLTVEQHETWARTVEAYLMEGKSPSVALSEVLARFRAWLVSVYKTLRGLHVEISDEVRGVIDRLIATDEAITEAQTEVNARQLFTSADQAGMTEAEFKAYTDSITRSRDRAEQGVLDKVMADVRKRRTAEWATELAAAREEARPTIDNQPDIMALRYLRDGTLPDSLAHLRDQPRLRLSREALIEEYGNPEIVNALPRSVPPLVVERSGARPGEIAELLGLPDARSMVDSLTALAKEQEALRASGDKRSVRQVRIDGETERLMRERHGDALTDGTIEAEALSAVHNDARADVLSAELRMLARKAGRPATPYKLARDWARRTIAAKTVAEISDLSQYTRAEGRASFLAEQAMVNGDADEALRRKQEQIIAHALWMEARDAKERVETARRKMDRLAGARTLRAMDQEYLERIHALLERFDLKPRSLRAVERSEGLRQWAEEQQAGGVDVAVPQKLLDEAYRTSYRRMSVEEFQGLADSVDQLAHLGRMKQKFIDGKDQREFDDVVEAAVKAAGEGRQSGDTTTDIGKTNFQRRFGAVISRLRSADAALLKVEYLFHWLDGNKAGPFTRLFQRMSDAQAGEKTQWLDVGSKLRALFHELPVETRRRMQDVAVYPELNGETLRRDALMAVALNMGNESNKDKLLKGHKWTEEGVMRAINRGLGPQELAFVQKTWDLIETLWPQIAAMERRVNGVAPEKVEPSELVTRHGTFRGGYYPMVYEPKRAAQQGDRPGALTAENFGSEIYTRATTPKGFTKERVEGFARPVHLSLDVIPRHLMEVIHDLHWREPIMAAQRFLNDARVKNAIREKMGAEYEAQLQPWLNHMALEYARDRQGMAGWDRFMKSLRTNVTAVGMGYRLSTIFSQVGGFSDSTAEIGTRWMASGFKAYAAHPIDTVAFVRDKSGEMRHRADTLDRDIRKATREMLGQDRLLDPVRDFAFKGVGWADAAVTVPTWVGAYNKALSEGRPDAEAVQYADSIVRRSQGASGSKDLVRLQTSGEAGKLITMFYSYFSHYYNAQRDVGRRFLEAETAGDFGDALARAFWLNGPGVLAAQLLAGQGPDKDESWGAWAARTLFFNMFLGVPIARDLANEASNAIAGKYVGGYQLSPAAKLVETAGTLALKDIPHLITGKPADRAVSHSISMMGYLTALPTGQAATTLQFLYDAMGSHQARPQDLTDWLKGVVYGPPPRPQ